MVVLCLEWSYLVQCKVKVNSLIFICLTVSVLLQSARCCDADKVSYSRAVRSVSSFRTLASVSVCQWLSIRYEKITRRLLAAWRVSSGCQNQLQGLLVWTAH